MIENSTKEESVDLTKILSVATQLREKIVDLV